MRAVRHQGLRLVARQALEGRTAGLVCRRRPTGRERCSRSDVVEFTDCASKAAELYGQTRARPTHRGASQRQSAVAPRELNARGRDTKPTMTHAASALLILASALAASAAAVARRTPRAAPPVVTTDRGARRIGGARARGRRAGQAAVAGAEDRAPAALAHLLEEPGRLRPADDAAAGSCRRAVRPATSPGRRRSSCRSGR